MMAVFFYVLHLVVRSAVGDGVREALRADLLADRAQRDAER